MKAVSLICIAALGLAVATGALRGADGKLEDNKMVKPAMGRVRKPEQAGGVKPEYAHDEKAEATEEAATPKFKPSMVPSGHFSGKPMPVEPVKPTMTSTGGLAAARAAEEAAERAKHAPEIAAAKAAADAEAQTQVSSACKRMEAVRTLAAMMYEQEKSADGSSRDSIATLITANCPHIKSGSPQAAAALNCAKVAKEVRSYFDAKFVGSLPQKMAERCTGKKIEIRNYAVAQALHSANNLFDVTFCPTVPQFNPCPADAAEAAKKAAEEEDTDPEAVAAADSDVSDAEAEAKSQTQGEDDSGSSGSSGEGAPAADRVVTEYDDLEDSA